MSKTSELFYSSSNSCALHGDFLKIFIMMTDERGPGHKPAGQPVTVTTTTTTTQPLYSLDWIKLDLNYFRTLPGYVKLIELVLGILCMILGSPATPYYSGGSNFYLFVVVMAFILTLILTFIYLLSVRESLQLPVPWVQIELYYTAGATIFYLLAMIVEFSGVSYILYYRSYYEAAAVFALFNTVVYAFGTFLLFKEFRGTATTTTVTTTQVADLEEQLFNDGDSVVKISFGEKPICCLAYVPSCINYLLLVPGTV
ncbi:unnamed protein product [Allacma fusca]|uniref:MARVEL domain-containing protein n=1 Tax=Allacma fusca TaxID=39272 RepID=A0A8J2P0N3_9HEXA|nr:unnamed protein product [Allacma fusca]